MPSVTLLTGLMKFLSRDEWRQSFEEIRQAHLFVACRNAKVDVDELGDIFGTTTAMTLWGCVFEDFLARDLTGGRNMVDDYLKRRSYKESPSAKAYMKAIRTSVMSLYEVSDIEPGRSFMARDLIRGGEPVYVTERKATTMMKPWDRIGARIVALGGSHNMCGGVLVYDFETADKVLAKFRWFESRVEKEMHAVANEVGSTLDVGLFKNLTANAELLELAAPIFTRLWLADALGTALNPRPIEFTNSDGDPILLCSLRFQLARGGTPAAACAALTALPELHRESETFFNWVSHDEPMRTATASEGHGITLMTTHSEGGTVLAAVEIKPDAVIVTTNSRQRAERAKSLIGEALGDRVMTATLDTETMEEHRTAAETPSAKPPPAQAIPPGVRLQVSHAFLDEHYRKTLDNPIAILGNRSPREAIMTAEGREQVINWLKLAENKSRHGRESNDPIATYDFRWMWEELGLAVPERPEQRARARA